MNPCSSFLLKCIFSSFYQPTFSNLFSTVNPTPCFLPPPLLNAVPLFHMDFFHPPSIFLSEVVLLDGGYSPPSPSLTFAGKEFHFVCQLIRNIPVAENNCRVFPTFLLFPTAKLVGYLRVGADFHTSLLHLAVTGEALRRKTPKSSPGDP